MESIGPASSDQLLLKGIVFTHGDISRAVEEFYRRVPMDEALQIPFLAVESWPCHIERLTHFWWTRFGGTPYRADQYDPVGGHFATGFNRALLSRWLTLFQEVLESRLRPEQAELWCIVAERMGNSLAFQNELLVREHRREQGEA
jgi:hemoglobin